jgi:hypothetical protein
MLKLRKHMRPVVDTRGDDVCLRNDGVLTERPAGSV